MVRGRIRGHRAMVDRAQLGYLPAMAFRRIWTMSRSMTGRCRRMLKVDSARNVVVTGISTMRAPSFAAMNRTSMSNTKERIVVRAKTARARSPRKTLKPHCVSRIEDMTRARRVS